MKGRVKDLSSKKPESREGRIYILQAEFQALKVLLTRVVISSIISILGREAVYGLRSNRIARRGVVMGIVIAWMAAVIRVGRRQDLHREQSLGDTEGHAETLALEMRIRGRRRLE